jgi:hypothetical protein
MVKINNNNKPLLPAGWIVVKSIRKGGTRRGMVDKIYLSPQLRAFRSFVSAQRFINANALNNVPNPVAPVPVASVANIVLVQDAPDSPVLVSDEEEEEEDAMNEITNLLISSEDEIDDEIELLLSSDEEIEL